MKNKILIVALALICLIGLISVVSAGKETQLTQNQRLVISTAIYDNIITWYETSGNSVNVYDLTKGRKLDIPQGYGGVAGNIPIYGSKIVWHDMDENITMYDVLTNKITQIATSGYDPDIYGNNIVYVKSISDSNYPYIQYYSVFLYNITTNKETQITEYGRFGYKPIVYGDKIVWSRTDWSRTGEDSKTSIYLYDIPTRQVNIVSENITPSNLLNAYNQLDFYGDIVVWSDMQNGKSDIYMQNISTHQTTRITTSGIASNPAICNNRIVYDNFYNMSDVYVSDIYMYDISTGTTTQITKCGCAWSPSIYNNTIAYVDSHATGKYNFEGGDIYVYDLSEESEKPKAEKPTATFTANVTSGQAPLRVRFTSETTGNPTDYYWVFEPSTSKDWNSHHPVTAVHTFTEPGVYTVTLTISNDAGSYTVEKEGYINVTKAGGPAARNDT